MIHSTKRRWAEDEEQIPVAFRAFHWQPVRSTKKMASIAFRSGIRGLWQPNGCFGRSGSRGSILAQSSSGNRQPSSRIALLDINVPLLHQSPHRWEHI